MKNQKCLMQLYKNLTGTTVHVPAPETDREKLSQYYIPKIPEGLR